MQHTGLATVGIFTWRSVLRPHHEGNSKVVSLEELRKLTEWVTSRAHLVRVFSPTSALLSNPFCARHWREGYKAISQGLLR